MPYTVEKIGGTSMSAFDAVLENIFLRPEQPYGRVFVVSAYSGLPMRYWNANAQAHRGFTKKLPSMMRVGVTPFMHLSSGCY